MKIGIDIRTVCGEKDGKGIYTFNIVKNLLELDKKNTYVLYSKEKPLGFYEYDNAEVVIEKASSVFWHYKVAKRAIIDNIDIFFSPTSYIIPSILSKNIRNIVTVHDLVAVLFPENHNKKAVFVEKLLLKRVTKRADKILTVSNSTRTDLIEAFRVKSGVIDIIGCGIGKEFKVLDKRSKIIAIKSRRFPDKFILAVGSIIPRKNYINLVKAFSRFYLKNKNYKLVIVGGEKWGAEELRLLIKKLNIENAVIMYGYASTGDLVSLYNLASCFLFISLYEGFGIPPLEAMACGCPVITSNTSSLPEVVGNAAIKVSPNSTDEILSALMSVLNSHIISENLVRRGTENLKRFSWKRSAESLLNIFESL